MFYYLSHLKESLSVFNVFNYITFRCGAAVLTGLLISLLIAPAVIRKLRSYKIGQVQRKDGPQSHLSKNGTPTMGGIIIIISLLSSVLLWVRPNCNAQPRKSLSRTAVWPGIFPAACGG